MKLKDVRRGTSADKTYEALLSRGACIDALEWIDTLMKKYPRLTAQGIWSKCKRPDWLAWLVDEIGDTDKWERSVYTTARANTISSAVEFCCTDCHPELAADIAKTLHRMYKSPWLE